MGWFSTWRLKKNKIYIDRHQNIDDNYEDAMLNCELYAQERQRQLEERRLHDNIHKIHMKTDVKHTINTLNK